ncbi:MAG: hypothetical protein HQL32_15455 [Planctomycetes bacterium]|nr:hypothetical protein [Planctomycetota bacterium]
MIEKCSLCVQRINGARYEAKRNGEKLDGTSFMTACQQACPASAIVFGDINQKKSPVDKARKSSLNYAVLEELGIKPRVTYLAKLRNTNSEAPQKKVKYQTAHEGHGDGHGGDTHHGHDSHHGHDDHHDHSGHGHEVHKG